MCCESNRRRVASRSKGASSRKRRDQGDRRAGTARSAAGVAPRHREGIMKAALLGLAMAAASLQRCGRAIDVSRRRRACGRLSRRGAAPVPSRQMEIPDRRPDRLIAGLCGRYDLFRRRRRQRLCRRRGRWPSALEAQNRRTRCGDAGDRGWRAVRRQLRRQVLRARRAHRRPAMEVRHRRRAPIRGEGAARHATEESDHRRSVRRLFVEPGPCGEGRCISGAATAMFTLSTPCRAI